ncbi:MAG: MaoC family dehydratase N-terminal domain-containing protein [Ruminococcus sp.]|nr:MaoC family dehydratase N-terminal domain-containing protein [Ruminococcus sp.]
MYFEDLKKGMTRQLEPTVIDKDEMLAFANRYDNVPLHTDEEYAKKTPFKQLIAPGVMSFMCVWAKYLEVDLFGEELIAGMSTKIEWFKPVFAGDVLTGTAVITDLVERNKRNGLAVLTIDIVNQNGETVMRDVTETVIKRREE